MKSTQWGCILLAMLLFFAAGAGAERTILMSLSDGQRADVPLSILPAGDSLYILGEEALYRYTFAEDAVEVLHRFSEAELERLSSREDTVLGRLFGDEQQVFLMDWIGESVFSWADHTLTYVCSPDWSSLPFARAEEEVYDIRCPLFLSGQFLFLISVPSESDSGTTALASVDPADGSCTLLTEAPWASICRYSSESLLVSIESRTGDQSTTELAEYSLAEGSLRTIATLDKGIFGMAYKPLQDAITYCAEGEIYALKDGAESLVGYIPTVIGTDVPGYVVGDTYLFCDPYQAIHMRPMEGAGPRRILRIAQGGPDAAAYHFLERNPEVQIAYVETLVGNDEELIQQVLSGDSIIDILIVDVAQGLRKLKEKGYFVDLSASAILADRHAAFYPAVQSLLSSGGAIVGLPYAFYLQAWSVNKELWNDLALGPLPATYPALMETFERFSALDESDGILYLGNIATVTSLYQDMIWQYILENEDTQAVLDFDDGGFRASAQAIKQLHDSRQISGLLSFDDESNVVLMYPFVNGLGAVYPGEPNDWMLPPAVGSKAEPAVYARMHTYLINPYSENADIALAYLESAALTMEEKLLIQLSPLENEPIVRKHWAEDSTEIQQEIDTLQAMLESAPIEERSRLEEELEKQQALLLEGKYVLTSQQIEDYRGIGGFMKFGENSLFLGMAGQDAYQVLCGVFQKYLDGHADLETMIQEMNRISRKYFLEGE